MSTTNNNAIFNYEIKEEKTCRYTNEEFIHTHPFQHLSPKMGPLTKNERNDFIDYVVNQCGNKIINNWYTLHFKKPQMYRKEVRALKIRDWEKYYKPSGSPYEERIHSNTYFEVKKRHINCNGKSFEENNEHHYKYERNPYHFTKMYRALKNMLKLKWKDIKKIDERYGNDFYGIKLQYGALIEWAQDMVEQFNQTSQFDFKDLKVGILKQNPHWEFETWSFKTFNSACFGNGKNPWLRKWCEEFVREFAHLNNLMEHVIYHYEKNMRMRTAGAKISAWFLRMKYNPKSPYCQKWLWQDLEDICEDEDDRRHNPFWDKSYNLRQLTASA